MTIYSLLNIFDLFQVGPCVIEIGGLLSSVYSAKYETIASSDQISKPKNQHANFLIEKPQAIKSGMMI
jgi:hypothetical protein